MRLFTRRLLQNKSLLRFALMLLVAVLVLLSLTFSVVPKTPLSSTSIDRSEHKASRVDVKPTTAALSLLDKFSQ